MQQMNDHRSNLKPTGTHHQGINTHTHTHTTLRILLEIQVFIFLSSNRFAFLISTYLSEEKK